MSQLGLIAVYSLSLVLLAQFIYFRFFKKDMYKSNLFLIAFFIVAVIYLAWHSIYFEEYANY